VWGARIRPNTSAVWRRGWPDNNLAVTGRLARALMQEAHRLQIIGVSNCPKVSTPYCIEG